MIKYFLMCILLVLCSCKKESLPSLDEKLTSEFFIESKEKNKTYRIWVQLPEGYHNTTNKYASMYVLDPDEKSKNGESNFFYMAKLCHDMSAANGKSNLILIGIRHGDYRETDYTPTAYSTKGFSGDGGAEAFLNFIKKELIPKVEKDYRAIPLRVSRIIIGHSLGGLCGAYAFTNHNEVFGNYLLLSPSLIYDNEIILQYEQEKRNLNKPKPQVVYFGVGGTEPNMVPPIDLMHQRIKQHYPSAVSTLYINPGKGHNSSKDPNIKKALSYYFSIKNQ